MKKWAFVRFSFLQIASQYVFSRIGSAFTTQPLPDCLGFHIEGTTADCSEFWNTSIAGHPLHRRLMYHAPSEGQVY
jgi:hypothetical protein